MAVSKLYRSSRASDEGHALWEALLCIAVLAVVGALAVTGGCAPPKVDGPVTDPSDTDGDGIRDGVDEDIDNDGILNASDPDIDGDGEENATDLTPRGSAPDQTGPQGDIDGDGVPNALDDDDDGNGIVDGVDGQNDCNGDGVPEPENSDCDGFCVGSEGMSACDDGAPPGSGLPDSDGDGSPDNIDPDDDNDGIPDAEDDNPNGTTDPGEGEGEACFPVTISEEAATQAPRILLVVDKSGSMDTEAVGFGQAGQSKWAAAVDALSAVLQSLSALEFGLMLYPNGDNDGGSCDPGSLRVDVGAGATDAIINILADTDPSGGTPTAGSLLEAQGVLDAMPAAGGPRVVVLATDGGPNCNQDLDPSTCVCTHPNPDQCGGPEQSGNCLDDVETVNAARVLNQAGYPVFVVGIPGTENFTGVLSQLAQAGGSAQAGAEPYYSATDADLLAQAIEDITVRVGSCRFDLPADATADQVTVEIGGHVIFQDPDRRDGWDLVDSNTVELFGVPCEDAARARTSVQMQVCQG